MKIEETNELYNDSYYIERINDVYNYIKTLFQNEEIENNIEVSVKVTLWKPNPKGSKEIAASKAIKYYVETEGSINHPGWRHIFTYTEALKYEFKENGIWLGESRMIYALIKSGVQPSDIFYNYKFFDDEEFMKTEFKYDIYIRSLNVIIEHHGTQHQTECAYFTHDNLTPSDGLKIRNEADVWKKDYCIKRGIKYIQFSIYDFEDTYMGIPVYKSENEVLKELGLRELSEIEIKEIRSEAKTEFPKNINNERFVFEWNEFRFVFNSQNDCADLLEIHKQTLKRWREDKNERFKISIIYSDEPLNIPNNDELDIIKKEINSLKTTTGRRDINGCKFTVIYENEFGELFVKHLIGYESCIECKELPEKIRAPKNILKTIIFRNSSYVAIKYNLMSKYKMKCLYLSTEAFNRMRETMSTKDIYAAAGKNITKGKMPEIVVYDKENPNTEPSIYENATSASDSLKNSIKVSSTAIENACFHTDHRVSNLDTNLRFCFLCEYKDRKEELYAIEDRIIQNETNDIVMIWDGIPIAHGGLRLMERCFGISRVIATKQINKPNKSPIKGVCDFKKYSIEKYGELPLFNECDIIKSLKEKYESIPRYK